MKAINKLAKLELGVKNMAPNQTVAYTTIGKVFFSYGTKVCAILNSEDIIYLTPNYRASKTTMRYVCEFLGVFSIRDVDKMIEEGKAKIEDF